MRFARAQVLLLARFFVRGDEQGASRPAGESVNGCS